MTNYKQPGEVMEYANSGSAISSGDVVVLGDRVGVAVKDIGANESGSVSLCGVYAMDKDGDEAFDQGDQLYYDAGDNTFTKTAAGNTPAGIAFEDAGSTDVTCRVLLCPHPKRAAHVADASSGSAAEINALRDALITAGLMKNA